MFGASDEVLGQIEDGLDFEKMIAGILDNCKTAAEIDAAFKELEERYSKQINREMKRTRAKVFDNLDPKVRDKLKFYDAQTGVVLNAFERLLIRVTRHELEDMANFNESGTQFTLHEPPQAGIPVGDYYFKSEPRKGAPVPVHQRLVCLGDRRSENPCNPTSKTHLQDQQLRARNRHCKTPAPQARKATC